jgi:hypothetical protein
MPKLLTVLSVDVCSGPHAFLSRFETLLPHGQPRLTFGEMRLPIPH